MVEWVGVFRIAEGSAATIDEVLGNPDRSSTLTTGVTFLLNTGIGADYRFSFRNRDDGGAWGFVLGVECGDMLAPAHTSWHFNGLTRASGGPNLGIEGFYVWLSLGGWGRGSTQQP